MGSKNVEAHRAAHEAFRQRDPERTVAGMAEDFVYRNHGQARTLQSREEFRQDVVNGLTGFPDARVTDATYHDAGDSTIAQFTWEGTNTGPFGDAPATGRRVSVPCCEVMHFDSEGRMVSGDSYYDMGSFMAQLGQVEPPAG